MFKMYSVEFDSGCLVCFIEIISWAEPQWEIPLSVWLTILALSRSWSCFQSCAPQVRPRSAIFHPYKSETKSIPVFFLGSPPPLPEYLPLHPRPCQHLPHRKSSVSRKNRNFLSSQLMGIDPWPWSELPVRVLWIPFSSTKQNRTCL